MNLIQKYNNLVGKTVSREYLVDFTEELFEFIPEDNKMFLFIWARIHDILDQYPDAKRFSIENLNDPVALLGSAHTGIRVKALTDCGRLKPGYKFLKGGAIVEVKNSDPTKKNLKKQILKLKKEFGLSGSGEGEYYPEITISPLNGAFLANGHQILTEEEIDLYDEDYTGLNASAKDVESIVNELILEKINTGADLPPWKKTWANNSPIPAQNFETKKEYTGSNSIILNILLGSVMKTPYYLTSNQIKKLGGFINKGSKSVPLVYYNFVYKLKDFSENKGKESELLSKVGSYTVTRKGKKPKKLNSSNYANTYLTEKEVKYLNLDKSEYLSMGFLRYYRVFNIADTTGIDYKLPEGKTKTKAEKIAIAEAIIKSFKDIPKIIEDKDNASYNQETDILRIPNISSFDNAEEYYSTLFHELIHSTLHQDRLNRKEKYKNKEQKAMYAFEELIAELGGSYLCGLAGILEATHINQAAYLKGWHAKLTKLTEQHQDFFVFATKEAQKAVDYIIKDYDPNKMNLENSKANQNNNPKGFDIKPNTISVANAIKAILKTKPYRDITERQAAILYKYFKDEENFEINQYNHTNTEFDINGDYEWSILNRKTKFHIFENEIGDATLALTPAGVDLIKSINGRLESVRNQKNNLALFDGLKVPSLMVDYPTLYLDVEPLPEIHVKTEVKPLPNFDAEIITQHPQQQPQPTPTKVENENTSQIVETSNLTIIPSKYKTAAQVEKEQKEPVKLFKIDGDLRKLLGDIEIKPVHSLLVTLDSEEGGGKTHSFYQWANYFASAGYPTIIWSLEEHKTSELSKSKCRKYFSPQAYNRIVVESENDGETPEDTFARLINSISDFEAVFIDSLPKLVELNNKMSVDVELRKAFNGKIIFLILQRTSDGKPRGGSKASFDGDIILKVDVDRADFRNNFIYNHKNRYNEYTPLSELKYSPYHQKIITEASQENPKPSANSDIIYSTF